VQHPAGVLVGRPDQVAIDTKPVAHRATSPPAEVQRRRYLSTGQGKQRSSRFWAFRFGPSSSLNLPSMSSTR
jgi:hypothetical protein